MMIQETSRTRLAAALHAACVALEETRQDVEKRQRDDTTDEGPADAPHWTDRVGRHVALAVAAMPDSVLRAWLLDQRVVGGEEIYKTLKVGASRRAAGRSEDAA